MIIHFIYIEAKYLSRLSKRGRNCSRQKQFEQSSLLQEKDLQCPFSSIRCSYSPYHFVPPQSTNPCGTRLAQRKEGILLINEKHLLFDTNNSLSRVLFPVLYLVLLSECAISSFKQPHESVIHFRMTHCFYEAQKWLEGVRLADSATMMLQISRVQIAKT